MDTVAPLEPIPDPLQHFLYEDEMRAFEAAGVTRLFSAFSREPGKPKTYVQQAIKNHSVEVWHLLQSSSVAKPRAWPQTFGWPLPRYFRSIRPLTAANAQAWLTGLVASHRYLEDI